MSALTLATSLLVLFGAALMFTAILRGTKISSFVPPELQRRWHLMLILMLFFLAGYLCLIVVLVKHLTLPIELIAGPVFLGGAFFVFIMISLTRDTIIRIQSAEEELRLMNESLEKRVIERTRDVQQSHEFLRTVLNSLNDEVLIIDTNTFKIQDANESFLAQYGLTLDEVIGRTCYELTHGRIDVCCPPNDICPLLETMDTSRFSTAEHIHYDKSGRMIYAEVSTSPIREPDGSIRQVVHVTRDITERKQAAEALRESEEKLRKSERFLNTTFDSIHDPFIILDSGYRVVRANEAYAGLRNIPIRELIDKQCHKVIYGKDGICEDCIVEKTFRSSDPCAKDKLVQLEDGTEAWFDIYTYPISDERGYVSHVIEFFRDITDRKRAEKKTKKLEEELRSMSLRDELTGLYNRRGFVTLAAQELKMAERQKKGIFILYADLDGLKVINDTLGHEEGDRVIQETAVILKETFRNSDIIGRIGGDEFVIIPIGTAGDNIEVITSRLQKNIDIQNGRMNRNYKLSLSVGIAYYDPEYPCTIDELLMMADSLMYEQKKNRRES